jgi:hypothetical protein
LAAAVAVAVCSHFVQDDVPAQHTSYFDVIDGFVLRDLAILTVSG